MKKKKKFLKRLHEPVFRAVKLSLANIWRNKFLSAATVLVMAILIVIFNIVLGIHFIAQSALTDLTKKVDIVVYLKDNVEYYEVQQMINEMKALNGITKVEYTSKTEALQIVSKTHPETAEFLSRFTIKNPLPPSLSVKTERPELHIMVQQFLNQEKYRHLLANVISENESQTSAVQAITDNLIKLSQTSNQIVFWVFAVFIFGSILIISNSIQLTIYNRQREIYIMRLVGATKNFISLPFLFEGLVYGLIAIGVSTGLTALMISQINVSELNIGGYMQDIPFLTIFFIELVATVLLGIICSFIAVYRYLKTKLILD